MTTFYITKVASTNLMYSDNYGDTSNIHEGEFILHMHISSIHRMSTVTFFILTKEHKYLIKTLDLEDITTIFTLKIHTSPRNLLINY